MMKFYDEITKLNERDMSDGALKRLRVTALLSLPFTPALAFLGSKHVSSPLSDALPATVVVLVLMVSSVALFFLCMNKLVNRVWVKDQYLDEWEVRMKHKSMAFAFQVVLYAIAILLFAGAALYFSDFITLPKFSPEVLGYTLFSLTTLGLYAQIYSQFSIVQPIEQDEMDNGSDQNSSRRGMFLTVASLIAIFVIVPFTIGVISGIHDVRNSDIAKLSKEAVSTCEARGSTVHWVSIAEESFGFACFDENRPAPENLSGKDSNP